MHTTHTQGQAPSPYVVTHAPLTSHRFPGNRASETCRPKVQLRRIPGRKRPDFCAFSHSRTGPHPLTSGMPKPIASPHVQRRPIQAGFGVRQVSAGRKWAGRGPRRVSGCIPPRRVTLYGPAFARPLLKGWYLDMFLPWPASACTAHRFFS